MKNPEFDFYDKTSLKSYNLNESMKYELAKLDCLDLFTRKHSESVASITCRLCEYLHLKKDFTVYCTMCAYMHDLGKQFIPPAVLQKPGKLTDEEYEVMKTHTTLGYELCMKDLKLRPYAMGAYCHHEALNGTGYPRGLTAKDIPYEAQIIRVADEFDAISSKRQYKSHIGISDTLKILIENTKPNENVPTSATLTEIVNNAKLGKSNPKIVKCLIKVVIDDTEYEISCKQEYLDSIEGDLARLKEIEKYRIKMENAKKEKDKAYYLEGMKMLLKQGETIENYKQVLDELQSAYELRKSEIDNLWKEIKIIKKLKV